MMKKNNQSGFTLIEMLIVIVVFSVIGVVSSETIILTLRGTAKADATAKVRNNLDYAVGAMERQIRGAKSVSCSAPPPTLNVIDQDNNLIKFTCDSVNTNHLPSDIASSSAFLTSSTITISACAFTCTAATSTTPAQVKIDVTAQDAGNQFAPVSESTQITLRSY